MKRPSTYEPRNRAAAKPGRKRQNRKSTHIQLNRETCTSKLKLLNPRLPPHSGTGPERRGRRNRSMTTNIFATNLKHKPNHGPLIFTKSGGPGSRYPRTVTKLPAIENMPHSMSQRPNTCERSRFSRNPGLLNTPTAARPFRREDYNARFSPDRSRNAESADQHAKKRRYDIPSATRAQWKASTVRRCTPRRHEARQRHFMTPEIIRRHESPRTTEKTISREEATIRRWSPTAPSASAAHIIPAQHTQLWLQPLAGRACYTTRRQLSLQFCRRASEEIAEPSTCDFTRPLRPATPDAGRSQNSPTAGQIDHRRQAMTWTRQERSSATVASVQANPCNILTGASDFGRGQETPNETTGGRR